MQALKLPVDFLQNDTPQCYKYRAFQIPHKRKQNGDLVDRLTDKIQCSAKSS